MIYDQIYTNKRKNPINYVHYIIKIWDVQKIDSFEHGNILNCDSHNYIVYKGIILHRHQLVCKEFRVVNALSSFL